MSRCSREERKLLAPGKVLCGFSIVRLVGQGGYGDIYEVIHTESGRHYAMKLEQVVMRKQALRRELDTMQHLVSCPYFPRLIQYNETPKYRYLVMELCGPSLLTLRRLVPNRRFSISTTLRCGIGMLRAIEACHLCGVLHRDIKPGNFLLRASRRYPLALIDYGLSRALTDAPPHRSGFVGTARYASMNAHAGRELGWRDDLFSWFYSMLELWTGALPWAATRDRQRIWTAKCGTDILAEIENMPPALGSVYQLIRKLEVAEQPKYKLMLSFMLLAMREAAADWDDPWEWEEFDLTDVSAISLAASDEREDFGDLPEPLLPPRPPIQGSDPEVRSPRPRTELAKRQLCMQLYEELTRRPKR
jgi:serine/threonine protein kinase